MRIDITSLQAVQPTPPGVPVLAFLAERGAHGNGHDVYEDLRHPRLLADTPHLLHSPHGESCYV